MGFEACHPAVNFIFFASVLWGTVSFQHPVFLAIGWLCAFAYSVRRAERKAVIFNLFLLPLIVIFALYYSAYHHFGVTVLRKNFIGNSMTLESLVYGLVIGVRFSAVCMWLESLFSVVSSDKVIYLFGRISPRLSYLPPSCCAFSPGFSGKLEESIWPGRPSAGVPVREISSGDFVTALGFSPC